MTAKSPKFDPFTNPFAASFPGSFPASFPMSDPRALRMFTRPLEQILQLQAEMLRASEPALTSWIKRQSESVDSALKVLEQLASCRDMNEAATIQRDWAEEQMKRWSSDLQTATEQAMSLSQTGMNAARQAAELTTEMASFADSAAKQRKAAE